MYNLQMTPMNIYLGTAIELIPRDELMAVIRQFDSEAEYPTVALLNKLTEDHGHAFIDQIAELGIEYAQTEGSMKKMQAAAKKLNRMSGKTEGTSTSEQSTNALGWFSAVSSFITTMVGDTSAIIRAVNGTDAASANAVIAQQNANAEREKTTRTLVVSGIALVVAIMLFFVLYKMFFNR